MTESCIIGEIIGYEDTRLVTLESLKAHIEACKRELESSGANNVRAWSLDDYCNKRKRTDLRRFTFCPICGKPIPWDDFRSEKHNVISELVVDIRKYLLSNPR